MLRCFFCGQDITTGLGIHLATGLDLHVTCGADLARRLQVSVQAAGKLDPAAVGQPAATKNLTPVPRPPEAGESPGQPGANPKEDISRRENNDRKKTEAKEVCTGYSTGQKGGQRMGKGVARLTPELIETIAADVRRGVFPKVAAAKQHVNQFTMYQWEHRGEREAQEHADDPQHEPSVYEVFYLAVDQAKGEASVSAESRVFEADPKFWLTHGYRWEEWRQSNQLVRVIEDIVAQRVQEQVSPVLEAMREPKQLAEVAKLILELDKAHQPALVVEANQQNGHQANTNEELVALARAEIASLAAKSPPAS
jgi:hypothetical protein